MGTSGSGAIQTGTKIQEEKIIADRSTAGGPGRGPRIASHVFPVRLDREGPGVGERARDGAAARPSSSRPIATRSSLASTTAAARMRPVSR